MNSLISNNHEFAFNFDDTPRRMQNELPFTFKFFDHEKDYDYSTGEPRQGKVFDQDSLKHYRSANESTVSDRCNAEYHYDEFAPIVVPFIDNNPHLGELERIVNMQINEKGYNNVVLDCLDMSTEDEIDSDNQDIIRKKQKKSRSQLKALKAEFKRRPNWTKRSMKKLAKELGLTTSQVYKWHWDQTNKLSKQVEVTSDKPASSHKRVKNCE